MVRIAEIFDRLIFQLQIKGLFVGLHYLATAVDDAGVTDFNRELWYACCGLILRARVWPSIGPENPDIAVDHG
jgi:hypothetical protein